MDCIEARQQLDLLDRVDKDEVSAGLAEHIEGCDDCRDYMREQLLLTRLASIPSPAPAPGFEQRVLDGALARKTQVRLHTRWGVAMAASVLLAVFLTLQYVPRDEAIPDGLETAVIEVEPGSTRMVAVRLNSASALEDARITLELDENVELEGYEGVRTLAWRTAIEAGDNRLSLPIRLLDDKPATVTVVLEHEGATRRLTIDLEAAPAMQGSQTLGHAV